MNKIFKLAIIIVAALGFTGCYNDFDEPAPSKVWTAEDFANEKAISIKDFKKLFTDKYGNGASSLAKTYEVTDDYVIHGKVISSDQAGNVYKSVYIYDGTGAIELKLMVSNWVLYHPGQTIFVRTKGLAIGSYRYMLSVGIMPTPKDIAGGYANSNIQTQPDIDAHIFRGALGELNASDTLVVNKDNYTTALTDDVLGRLVRFEGLQYKVGEYDGDKYPQYLEVTYPNGATQGVYTNRYTLPDGSPFDTYAFNNEKDRYYGSSWFSYNPSSKANGNYIVRVSGYANFATQKLPVADSNGDITAIYTKYSAKSGGFIKYQLLINSYSDIDFELTLTPDK